MKLPKHLQLRIEHNDHKTNYMSLKEYMEGPFKDEIPDYEWVSPEEKEIAIANDELWQCHIYPSTPNGFYSLAAATFESLLNALEKISEMEKELTCSD